MLYGEDLHVINRANSDAERATAIALEASTGAILTKTMEVPGMAMAFGFIPTVLFNYDTQTVKGVLKLYKYPLGVEGNKVLLGTINLEDGDLVGKFYKCRISSKVPYTSPIAAPGAKYNAGDQLVIVVATAATGGGYIAGDFQPVVLFSNRGEADNNQAMVVDRTPAVVGV
ncbi:hypothetical protein DFAR_3900012 [Desulfarculales bacterium]